VLFQNEVELLLGRFGSSIPSGNFPVHTPIDGSKIASIPLATAAEIDAALNRAQSAFLKWRSVPAPRRGELVRRFGNALRDHKADLARLVTIECGKPISEGEGEVQEMIDICDFAVGLSRQLHGLTIASERPGHRMMEQWHPLGPTLIISAFNFPVAVWAWNAALALVCGNSIVWKPSEKTPLTALATQALLDGVLAEFDDAPDGLSQVIVGARDTGAALVADRRIALVSATGSTEMGRAVGQAAAARFAKTILELGGNNAAIVSDKADLDLALRGVLFSAVGTSGQRCTSLRRLFVHDGVYDGQRWMRRRGWARSSAAASGTTNRVSMCAPPLWKWAIMPARPCVRPLRRSFMSFAIRNWMRQSLCRIVSAQDCHRRSSRSTCANVNCSCRHQAAIAGLPMSISAHQARRLAVPLAGKRKPAVGASPGLMLGRPICAAPPTPSITVARYPWRRVCGSTFEIGGGPAKDCPQMHIRCVR